VPSTDDRGTHDRFTPAPGRAPKRQIAANLNDINTLKVRLAADEQCSMK
jgi:hypothetical protein